MITYGLKGMAAYSEHALNLGLEDPGIYAFIYEALAATLDDSLTADDLVALTMRTGEHGVRAMALLDKANTSATETPRSRRSTSACAATPPFSSPAMT
jgi:hydroxylamine reductase